MPCLATWYFCASSTVSVLAALGRFFFALCQFVGTGFLFCSPILEEWANLCRPKGSGNRPRFGPSAKGYGNFRPLAPRFRGNPVKFAHVGLFANFGRKSISHFRPIAIYSFLSKSTGDPVAFHAPYSPSGVVSGASVAGVVSVPSCGSGGVCGGAAGGCGISVRGTGERLVGVA